MGAKALYTDTKNKIINALIEEKDIESLNKLDKDRQEYLKYSGGWKKVNLDEYLSQFDIVDDTFNMVTGKRKISFFTDGKEYEIVCAVGASYFRIIQCDYIDSSGRKHGKVYVNLDLKEPRIPSNLRGKDAKAERNRLTHFKMTYKKGK